MTANGIQFERGDVVRMKSDRLVKYIVLGVIIGSYGVAPEAILAQMGTGFTRRVPCDELEFAY